MDRRDPVVAQAIQNVAARKFMDEGWASPLERAKAIYDELRRLDLARVQNANWGADRSPRRIRQEAS
jgi:hypothetical protein